MVLVGSQLTASPDTTVSARQKRSVKLAIKGWPDSDETQAHALTCKLRESVSASKRPPQIDI